MVGEPDTGLGERSRTRQRLPVLACRRNLSSNLAKILAKTPRSLARSLAGTLATTPRSLATTLAGTLARTPTTNLARNLAGTPRSLARTRCRTGQQDAAPVATQVRNSHLALSCHPQRVTADATFAAL